MLQSTAAPGFLSRERTVAGPGFNRWLTPPAALAIHLCIGMIYGFSVFWLPLSKAIGVTTAKTCPADMSLFAEAVARDCDWKVGSLDLDLHARHRLPRLLRRRVRPLAGDGRTAQGRSRLGLLLVRGASDLGARGLPA